MDIGQRVLTCYGPGEILKKDTSFSKRFCLVKLDKIPDSFKHTHKGQGGLYLFENELKEESTDAIL